jgi:hypothetical protein
VLLLVDTATHIRWIDYPDDDFDTTHEYESEALRAFNVLDGPLDRTPEVPYPSNQAILMSYMTYFFRSVAYDDSNLTQFFLNKTIMPPDIVGQIESEEIVKQLHLYSKGRHLPNINKLSVGGKGTSELYVYNGIGVRRSISGNDRELNRPDGLYLGSTLDKQDLHTEPPTETTTFPLMNEELVFAVDSTVRFKFRFTSEVNVVDSDVLVAAFAALNPDGSLCKDEVTVTLKVVLVDGLDIEIELTRLLSISRDIILPFFVGGLGAKRRVSGNLSTVEELKVPLKWLFQTCLFSDVLLNKVAIKEIEYVCRNLSGNPVRFGLGAVGVMNLNDWRFPS